MMVKLKRGSVIRSRSSAYLVETLLGSGSYGNVALCKKLCSRKTVALKVMKDKDDMDNGLREKSVLEHLGARGSEDFHIVSLRDSFPFRGHYCLELEHLDISLFHFTQTCGRLSLMEIRPILHQLASGLSFIRSSGFIHGDLKPENVMMVNHRSSLRVKIIDFGLAHGAWEAAPGTLIQTGYYRAPEVFLGCSYSSAVDVWSLGCVAVELLLGKILFPGNSDADVVRNFVKTIGFPSERMLESGVCTNDFFHKRNVRGNAVWKIKSMKRDRSQEQRPLNRLSDLFHMQRWLNQEGAQERQLDCEFFMDLVFQMLQVDPDFRISAEDVLQVPFIAMSHMIGVFQTTHVSRCVEVMLSASCRSVLLCEDQDEPPASHQGAPRPQRDVATQTTTRLDPKRRREATEEAQARSSTKRFCLSPSRRPPGPGTVPALWTSAAGDPTPTPPPAKTK